MKTLSNYIMTNIHLIHFNCNGLNSSINDVFDLLNDRNNAIFFISEHWLRSEELNGINDMCKSEGLWSHFKSSVDPEVILTGRPYGGVGFICKRENSSIYSFRIINVECDRVAAIQVVKNGQVLMNIIGLYLPYFNGRPEQSETYAETLDIVQSIIDSCPNAPIVIMGDMNASLPQNQNLHNGWYRSRPFNSNSLQLYDFLSSNELAVTNFLFQQQINYTYKKGDHHTYIDHIFMSEMALKNVTDCKILSPDPYWTSDHLPMDTIYKLNLPYACPTMHNTEGNVNAASLNWDVPSVRTEYKQNLTAVLSNLNLQTDCSGIKTCSQAQNLVNKQCEEIANAIYKTCNSIAKNKQTKSYGPRKVLWWSTHCNVVRDRT